MKKNRTYITFSILLFCFYTTKAQIYKPVKWNFSVKNSELVFTATIDKGWHLYSQNPGNDDVIPTTFQFDSSNAYVLQGKVEESHSIRKKEPVYDNAEISFFENTATFKQKITLTTDTSFYAKGIVNFMVCNDSMCLPPEDVEFSINVNPSDIKKNASQPSTINKISHWSTFILGFLGGLLALLTPCVFPMIPLTVSFFTKQGGNKQTGIKNALLYSFSIVFIYVLLGFLITVSFGSDALNALSSNEWMNLLFFVIFIVFGISFLGAFEITLPSSWVNKADKASEKGGLIGIFFMAFTLSLVSFSCTGPIIGSLLVQAASGGSYLGPLIGMLGFSLALALPFGLFAMFPGWLNSLPKSGGWLNNVKVVLGLLEIAFALKFLSIVDLAGLHIETFNFHINGPLGILKREVFIALWIVIFSVLGFYLLGKIKFSHDSKTEYVSIPKLLFSILTFSFVIYLIPGLWGAPLKLISGFPPPSFYSEGWNSNHSNTSASNGSVANSSSHAATCPHNINCFHDYDEALVYAKEVKKPILIDFTGWACVNCRKMEENVWSNPDVLQRLNNDYVLVSLYVDDKTELAEDKKYTSSTTGKKIKTIGNKWSDFQIERFKNNSQPWYVLLDTNEKELTPARGYDPCIPCYIEFLDTGKKEFTKN